MIKKIAALSLIVLLISIMGCKEEMVGAPCVPETDNGKYYSTAKGVSWSIENGSVQCATHLCLTNINAESSPQKKFSFCSCRCADAEGNKLSDNPDKYSDLCECPGKSICDPVMDPIPGISDKLFGSYCVPDCISKNNDETCDGVCTPSDDDEEPWKWTCED